MSSNGIPPKKFKGERESESFVRERKLEKKFGKVKNTEKKNKIVRSMLILFIFATRVILFTHSADLKIKLLFTFFNIIEIEE